MNNRGDLLYWKQPVYHREWIYISGGDGGGNAITNHAPGSLRPSSDWSISLIAGESAVSRGARPIIRRPVIGA